jgi:hypothetical protein
MTRRASRLRVQPVGLTPHGTKSDASGEPSSLPESNESAGTHCAPPRLRASEPTGEREPALESEDGDMFLHSEEDTDY